MLTNTEHRIAEEYCKGLSDKEVAANLCKSYWTVKTEKRNIYRKLGISKDTELLWYMICERLKKDFDLKEIRKHGIELLMCMCLLIMQITNNCGDIRRCRAERGADIEVRANGRLSRY